MRLHVAIVGAGNLGLACAARMAAQGVAVTLFTHSPEKWSGHVAAEDTNGRRFAGMVSVSADVALVNNVDLVFFCLPGNAMRAWLLRLAPHLKRGTPLLSVYSGDGFFFFVQEILGGEWPAMGFQRVPYICRTKIPFRLGGITGYRKELRLAHRNIANPDEWRSAVEELFGTLTILLDNYYEAALVNGNTVLHPARLMSLQMRIDAEGPYEHSPLFYEEWDDEASRWAICLDAELRAVAAKVGAHVQPLLEYYESTDAASLARKLRSIVAFRGIVSPLTPAGKIDFQSRYVQADVKIALALVSRLAHEKGLTCKTIDQVLERFG